MEGRDDTSTCFSDLQFIEQPKDIETPVRGNSCPKHKTITGTLDAEKYPKLDSCDDTALLRHVYVTIEDETCKQWKQDLSKLQVDFVTLVEALEATVKSILLYAIASENSDNTMEAVVDNVNTCLTSLEEYIGADHGEIIGNKFPNASIALKEMIACLDKLSGIIHRVKSEASAGNTKADHIQASTNIDKQQSLT
eukprot:6911019-Ditylum_brightwellii.AAC.2